ncbi:MAG: RidA family protein [Flavobacteriaceae bacterium]
MDRKNISSGSAFEKTIGFARAVRFNDRIMVSGTAPIANDGKTAFPGDVFHQTKHCIELMQKAIEKAGGRLTDVVRTRIYLKHKSDWRDAARAHQIVFDSIKPACTFVVIKGFIDPQWLVETEAECIL